MPAVVLKHMTKVKDNKKFLVSVKHNNIFYFAFIWTCFSQLTINRPSLPIQDLE